MSDKKSDQLGERTGGFAGKNKLWLVIPLVIFGPQALKNLNVGLSFLLFFVAVCILVWAFGKILSVFKKLLPKSLSQDQSKAIHDAGKATIFLGGFAIIGIILRNDNFLSDGLKEKVPEGVSIGFIDPTFAAVVLLCVWIYTGYRVSR